ncbi:MAG: hypothetical protein AABZ47_12570, partial [Planctomycetota bacterium]
MRLTNLSFLGLLLFPITQHSSIFAQIPPNDLCINATPIGNVSAPFTNINATNDGIPASCGAFHRDVWYLYTATCNGLLKIDTCGATFDSKIQVLDGPSCTAPEISDGCNNNNGVVCGGGSDDAAVRVLVNVMGQYLIRVGSTFPFDSGTGVLSIACEEFCTNPNPANCCAEPQPTTRYGCGRPGCCNSICAIDPFCCGAFNGIWDNDCILEAQVEQACMCPCVLPGIGTPENEQCINLTGDPNYSLLGDTHGGCNIDPPYSEFEIRSLPTSILGTTWAFLGQRDTDWYRFQVPDANASGSDQVVFTLSGNAPVGLIVLDATNCNQLVEYFSPDPPLPALFDGLSAECNPDLISLCLPPGTYTAFVSTFDALGNPLFDDPFNAFVCGAQDGYELQINLNPTCPIG